MAQAIVVAGCALGLVLPVIADDAGDLQVVVKTTSHQAIEGQLITFSIDQGLEIMPDDADARRHFEAADIVRISMERPTYASSPPSLRLGLRGDDRLAGRVVGFRDDALLLETDTIGTVQVPLDWIRDLRTPAADTPKHRKNLEALLKQPSQVEDVLLLVNGDELRGFISSIDQAGVTLDSDPTSRLVEFDSLAACVLAATQPPGIAKEVRVRIHTSDGQRITGSKVRWSGPLLQVHAFDDSVVTIPADRLSHLEVMGGRWEWLSEFTPISYQHTAALGLPWHWKRDQSVVGSLLKIEGRTFEYGIGVHSECSLTFDLEGTYSAFVTSLGLDDRSGPFANVDVEIRVDGQIRYERSNISPGYLIGPLRLDVTEAKRIRLSVLFGKNADLQDRFDWIEPALIR